MAKNIREKLRDAEENALIRDAKLRSAISRKGDNLAKKEGYKSLDGMEAIVRYLVDKHHWLPHEVRTLSTDDLVLLLDGYPFDEPL
jgi:hypothetical protein